MTTTCYTPSYIPFPFYPTCTGLEPRPRYSRAGKIVILAFFASSFVRNNIYYVNLELIELPSIVKLHTCHPLYDHLINEKPWNYTLPLVSEQHNYATWSASLQHLNPCFSRINIRKFCPTVIGCYYWNDLPLSVYITWHKKALYQYYFFQY